MNPLKSYCLEAATDARRPHQPYNTPEIGHTLHSLSVTRCVPFSPMLRPDSSLSIPPQAFPPVAEPSNGANKQPIYPIGVIVCKQDVHKSKVNRGYIAMLSVNKAWRKRGIGESSRSSVKMWRS